jgi:hypothetical protein
MTVFLGAELDPALHHGLVLLVAAAALAAEHRRYNRPGCTLGLVADDKLVGAAFRIIR